ncbi:MAG: DUF2835 domain-containing protein [Geothrix sp.]|nr:DUF2835 domain-containing protein [Geothrix sp.]
MKRFEFQLRISPERYLDYYRGTIRQVVVRCPDGVTIQFPASLLQPFVTPAGIQGSFVLTCDEDNKGADLQRSTLRN